MSIEAIPTPTASSERGTAKGSIATIEYSYRPVPFAYVSGFPVEDELLLYVPDVDAAFSLNRSARAVWEACDGSRSVHDVARFVAEQFGMETSDLLPDIITALLAMNSHGLLELCP